VLTSVSRPDASTTTITGTLDSTAGATYRIEFFSNDECASSGNGEGRTFLGALTGVQPNVAFTFTTTTPVSADEFITSTATNETTRDTSEFSVCIPDTTPPRVGSIVRAAGSTNPVPPGSTVTFTVTFSEAVTGVDSTDFVLTTTGDITGASVTGVTGSGTTYTVTVSTGSGTGTIRLDVNDDDTIKDAVQNPLGGTGIDNGDFTGGETFTVQRSLSINDVTQAEGNAGTTTFTFTVSLNSPAPAGGVTFDITTTDDTAQDGTPAGEDTDYVAKTETGRTIAASQTSTTFTITVNGDTTVEEDETFTVDLSNVTGATVSDAQGTGTILNDDGAASAGQVIISEFRLRGPDPDGEGGRSGEFDEFIEIYNTTDADIIVVDSAPGNETDGWAIVSSDDTGTAKYVIPVGTRIPARGHFLVANFGATLGEIIPGYSLGAYAAADDSYSQDIPDGSGLALFRTANSSNFTAANRLDAVGFTTVGERFREGTGLTTPVTVDNEHSFGHKLGTGRPQDTGDNAADFALVSTDPLALGSNAVLGAPGPENRTSPIQRNGSIKPSLIDPNCPSGSTGCQNQVRDQPVAGQPEVPNQRFGTLRFRRRFTNTSGQPVTQLRFRVVTITTLNSPGYDPNNTGAGQADLRVVTTPGTNETTGDIMVTLLSNGQTIPVRGTRVETPPDQPNGGGLNSSIVTVTPVTPIAPGESVAVEFTLGVEQRGNFSFFINVEATLEEPQLGVQPAATKGIRGKAARGVAPSK